MKLLEVLKQKIEEMKSPKVGPVDLPPLAPLPSTKPELAATAPEHKETIRRVERINKLIDDYRRGDAVLTQRRF